jgi:drug/metabolite transporter (DMT)-like permease
MTIRTRAYLQLLIVSIIWGLASPIIKFTLTDFPPTLFLVYRFGISSVIAVIFLWWKKPVIDNSPKQTGFAILYSFLAVTVGLGLLFLGLSKTSSLIGSVLHSIAPIVTALAGAIILHEKITKHELWGTVLAFFGTLLILFSPLLMDGGVNFSTKLGSVEGNVLVMSGLFLDVMASIVIKFISKGKTSIETISHISFIFGFFTLIPILFYQHSLHEIIQQFQSASLLSHLGVWYMAVFSGTIAYILRNKAVATIDVSETAIFTYLLPLWSAPVSLLVLHESIHPSFWIGAVIIALGIVIAEWHKKKRLKRNTLNKRNTNGRRKRV